MVKFVSTAKHKNVIEKTRNFGCNSDERHFVLLSFDVI